MHHNNVSDCYKAFISYFIDIINRHAPLLKRIIPYRLIIRPPWMTSGLMKSSNRKQCLYKLTIGRAKNSVLYQKLMKYRNLYHKTRRYVKMAYYRDLLHVYSHDIRKSWRVLNTLIGRTNDKSSISDTFIVNNKRKLMRIL